MPVSSYILRCRPADQDRVVRNLKPVGEFMIGARAEEGIAVAVASDSQQAAEGMSHILDDVPGVLGATLVYYNTEETLDFN